MKFILTYLFVLLSIFSNAQNRGYIYYLNQVKASEDIQEMKKHGLNFQISPILINVEKFPKIDTLLEDYKTYISTWYRQINTITFLDSYEFAKLDKRGMKIQTLCYTQKKYEDYKWGGCKYFEIFHVFSELYFTTYVKEYSDRYEMEVTVAEKLKLSDR